MDVGSTELKILQVTQPYVNQCYSQGVCLSWRRTVNDIYFLLLFCSFFLYIRIICLPSCMVNKYYYIQRRGVTLKSNRSRSLKMGPIDRSCVYMIIWACVTITSSGVCFVSKQLASISFRRQVLSTLLVQRWRGSISNVRLSSLLISSCINWTNQHGIYN